MKEKTLRYPGHIDLMKGLIKSGFLNTAPIKYKGQEIVPLAFTSALLFDQWKLGANEAEFTLMIIKIIGGIQTIQYELYDEYDAKSETSSMSRTTGYTCTAAVNLLINQLFTEKGVYPPELVGKDEACFTFILNYLRERGVNYVKTIH